MIQILVYGVMILGALLLVYGLVMVIYRGITGRK